MSVISVSPEEQLRELRLGVEEIISEEELLLKFKKSFDEQKPLIIKLGADPSRPDIHLGHTVIIQKLKLLQDFGHQIKFIIGDFTAMIGDPTGKTKTRPQLTKEEVLANAETYKEQIFKILDPEKTDIVYNSEWIDQLTPSDMIKLMSERTVQQLLARDDFTKRYHSQTPIFLHEFMYPVMQAYDSLVLKADLELGGTDQKFNLLLGREMQRQHGQRPQNVLLMPILEGLDGVQKMSKSLDNYISLSDTAKDMFGKTMSISDDLMIKYYKLLSRKGAQYVEELKNGLEDGSVHPMAAKKDLAEEITSHYYGDDVAKKERQAFDGFFSKKEIPDDLPEHCLLLAKQQEEMNLLDLSVQLGFSKSKGEARRILKQNGMKIDGKTIATEKFVFEKGGKYIFKQGRLRIVALVVL